MVSLGHNELKLIHVNKRVHWCVVNIPGSVQEYGNSSALEVELNHCFLGDEAFMSNVQVSSITWWFISWVFKCTLSWNKWQRISDGRSILIWPKSVLIYHQRSSGIWLDAIRLQAIIWVNNGQGLCRHKASQGHIELTIEINVMVQIYFKNWLHKYYLRLIDIKSTKRLLHTPIREDT